MKFSSLNECTMAITDEDIIQAMKQIPGYLDITPSDFMEIYLMAFGASAVLIYGAVRSPLAQPRILVGGHLISALIGVIAYKLFYPFPWFASALAVATAIAFMHATKTLHPPGGATALIAVIGSDKVHALGFLYVFIPVGIGVLVMLAVALIVNNMAASRKYPEFWF